jgi:hypothetical protein
LWYVWFVFSQVSSSELRHRISCIFHGFPQSFHKTVGIIFWNSGDGICQSSSQVMCKLNHITDSTNRTIFSFHKDAYMKTYFWTLGHMVNLPSSLAWHVQNKETQWYIQEHNAYSWFQIKLFSFCWMEWRTCFYIFLNFWWSNNTLLYSV